MEDGLIPEANTGTLAAEVPSVDDDKDSTTDQCSNARSSSALPCEMCQNYEINLTIIQDNERKLKEELKAIKSLSDRYEAELATEREYRMDLERKMTELSAQIEDMIKEAVKSNSVHENRLLDLLENHNRRRELSSKQLTEMNAICSKLESDIQQLTKKYQSLLGANRTTAAAMRAEPIDLPLDADQLQFVCLQMREELIEMKSGREHSENELGDEIALLREQLTEERGLREFQERDLLQQVNHLQTQLGIADSKLSLMGSTVLSCEEHSRQIRDLQNTIAELEAQVTQVQNERTAVEMTAQNYKARCFSLQNELDTSEAVQKDFVKLSQSLQIQLEKIRQSEQEVRWQWDEDVENCSGCDTSVVKLKPRPRCLHCGKIFCHSCVKTTVPSGPNRRPANVCQVCHTLLNRDSKPFFAEDPRI